MKLSEAHNSMALAVVAQGVCWLVSKWLFGDGGWTDIFANGAQVGVVVYFVMGLIRNTRGWNT